MSFPGLFFGLFTSYTWRGILSLHPANRRRHYKVTPSLIGWAQTIDQPCITNQEYGLVPIFCSGLHRACVCSLCVEAHRQVFNVLRGGETFVHIFWLTVLLYIKSLEYQGNMPKIVLQWLHELGLPIRPLLSRVTREWLSQWEKTLHI